MNPGFTLTIISIAFFFGGAAIAPAEEAGELDGPVLKIKRLKETSESLKAYSASVDDEDDEELHGFQDPFGRSCSTDYDPTS